MLLPTLEQGSRLAHEHAPCRPSAAHPAVMCVCDNLLPSCLAAQRKTDIHNGSPGPCTLGQEASSLGQGGKRRKYTICLLTAAELHFLRPDSPCLASSNSPATSTCIRVTWLSRGYLSLQAQFCLTQKTVPSPTPSHWEAPGGPAGTPFEAGQL